MSQVQYPDVNGVRTSYCSIVAGFDGFPIVGLRSINYREPLEIGKIRGTSPKPIGRTRGNADIEGDMEMYAEEWKNQLLPKLAGLFGLSGFSEASIPIKVSYAERRNPSGIHSDHLIGVRIHSPDRTNTEGTDASIVKLTLDIMDIVWANKYRSLRG